MKTKKAKPEEKTEIRTKEFLEYKFTDAELKEIAANLARITSDRVALENEKKTIVSEFKAKLDGKEAELESLAGKINTGREHRYVECLTIMNEPVNGKKTIFRMDSNTILRKEEMSADEKQVKLNFSNEEKISRSEVIHSVADDNN